jgi:7-cyano-7-deazaguanine reductase
MSQKYGEKEILKTKVSPLEKWVNNNGSFLIHLEHPEFSALCPRSGYPDSGIIVIDYIPDKWVVELKSFKLMINGFRDEKISHEDVVNQIANRFFDEINPLSLRVIGDFMRRGGVKTVISVNRGDSYTYEYYKASIL